MVACCNNFRAYGKTNVILSFVFPSEERINRLRDRLCNRYDHGPGLKR